MSLMQRRRALLGALSEARRILPGTVIWENGVTGTDGLMILEHHPGSYGAWNEPVTGYDISIIAQRNDSSGSAGACVIGLCEPLDFSLCNAFKCEYMLIPRGDSYNAISRIGLGLMPPDAQAFHSDPAAYLPDSSAVQRTVRSTSATYTDTIEISDTGVMVPMISLRTGGAWSTGYLRPLKIWVE